MAQKFGGRSSVKSLTTAGDTLFVLGGPSRGKSDNGGTVYKIEQATGLYKKWIDSPAAELAIDKMSDVKELQEATAIAAYKEPLLLKL